MDATSYLSTSQAARRLEVSSERVRQLARAGCLPAIETPLGRLLPTSGVERLAEERRAQKGN